jgi:hypothetical protein
MAHIEITHHQQRLLAALFTRGHISGRRRRYVEGYLMSELDGANLSQSDIWNAYHKLTRVGLITAQTVHNNLVFKLTPEGDKYCREVIYPDLFSPARSGWEAAENIGPEPIPADVTFAQGLTIDQILGEVQERPDLAQGLLRVVAADSNIREDQRDQVRSAIVRAARGLEDLSLPNFEAAQAKAHISIVMIYLDAPVASKKDIGQHIVTACTIIGAATGVGSLLLSTLAFLAAH